MALDTALAAIRSTLYYCCLPALVVLRPLWAALVIITAPIVHVAHYLFHAIAWPTLYIYFGVAVLVGILLGALVHNLAKFLTRVLGIDKASDERGRTLASYRAEKTERQAKKAQRSFPQIGLKPLRLDSALKDEYADWLKRDKSPSTKGPLFTTILEEEDSSEAGF